MLTLKQLAMGNWVLQKAIYKKPLIILYIKLIREENLSNNLVERSSAIFPWTCRGDNFLFNVISRPLPLPPDVINDRSLETRCQNKTNRIYVVVTQSFWLLKVASLPWNSLRRQIVICRLETAHLHPGEKEYGESTFHNSTTTEVLSFLVERSIQGEIMSEAASPQTTMREWWW